jgi:4-hydroxy-tetrahydrodipicolinate reductase
MRRIPIFLMVNGLPGSMATKVAERIMRVEEKEYEYPFYFFFASLTGPEIAQGNVKIGEGWIDLIRPDERTELVDSIRLTQKRGLLIAVDYTHPLAVNANAEFYCSFGIPFVMGTTGGDREKLTETVLKSKIPAVIAPNMAKQIVMFQAMMRFAANNFPNAFEGYTLEIVESHQKGKADTSGTAKAMVEYFNLLGIPFTKEQIVMVRDPERQLAMGVPEEHLTSHGWHTYTVRSSDGSILFRFTHNVNGRDGYAQGTLDAILFLAKEVQQGNPGKIYSMEDVLKSRR